MYFWSQFVLFFFWLRKMNILFFVLSFIYLFIPSNLPVSGIFCSHGLKHIMLSCCLFSVIFYVYIENESEGLWQPIKKILISNKKNPHSVTYLLRINSWDISFVPWFSFVPCLWTYTNDRQFDWSKLNIVDSFITKTCLSTAFHISFYANQLI